MASRMNENEKGGTNEAGQAGKSDVIHDEVLVNADLMNDAVDGENLEHSQGIIAAIKSHPWACLWAFVMCFTIVRT